MDSILVSIVNYGDEQLEYLQEVIHSINSFDKYDTTIFVTTNISLDPMIEGIDHVVLVDELPSWQLLPLMARRVINNYIGQFDYYIYTENDHLWEEHHIDNYKRYEEILPEGYVSGLIQYEYDETGRYYPAYHAHYDWDYNSVEEFGGLKFAHFNNVHQASFLLSDSKINKISSQFDLDNFWSNDQYSFKCKVNTEIYKWSGLYKVICISEFDKNLIHHLPNVYINGDDGYVNDDGTISRRAKQRAEESKMKNALSKLL